MYGYIIKRILLIIPTILVIWVIAFLLGKNAYGVDGAEAWLMYNGIDPNSETGQKAYMEEYERQKLNLPYFYFSILPNHYHPNVHSIPDRKEREIVETLQGEGCNYIDALVFLNARRKVIDSLSKTSADSEFRNAILFSTHYKDFKSLNQYSHKFENVSSSDFTKLMESVEGLSSNKSQYFTPKFIWHGADNQFHVWIRNLFSGKLGTSITDGRQVTTKIGDALRWTLTLLVLNIFFTLLISIPFGMWAGYKPNSGFDKISQFIWMVLYATPVFWLASMLILYFTSGRYGAWMHIFPTPGLWYMEPNQNWWAFLRNNGAQLILPVICLVANDIAFLTRIIRNNVVVQTRKRYALVADSKGLSSRKVLFGHILPNVLIPLITIIVAAIPAGLSGSLMIEVIFNIPGMGRLMFDSIQAHDWNIVFSILSITGLLVSAFILIGDLLYAMANPKVRYHV